VTNGGNTLFKQFRVYEGIKLLLETENLEEAKRVWRQAHREDKYHEIHRWHEDDQYLGKAGYVGTYQLEPYDCPECGRRPGTCKCGGKSNELLANQTR